MKSLFDFNRWTEATRGASRWSWTEKSGSGCSAPTSAGKPANEVAL
ncbi:hypothetical protein [Bacillus sp. FJAT-27251]|nr:hypothetical protein [Bacillus sp. FJAT-27251]